MSIKIMLDAGHYGKYNRSPAVPQYYESVVMWELQNKLKTSLSEYACTVSATRTEQTKDKGTYERGKAARGCDLFLSLHSNAATDKSVDRVVVYKAFDADEKASKLASALSETVASVMGIRQAAVKTRESTAHPGSEYYGVLRGAKHVGVPYFFIIEHSFHTHKASAEWLLSEVNLDRLAKAEAKVISDFFALPRVGDLNGDGKIDALDYMALKSVLLSGTSLSDEQKRIGDVNGDGTIDALDYMALKKKILEQ